MKIWFLRILVWFSLRLRIYYAWSRVYQRLWEKRKYKGISIPLFPSFTKIEEITGAMHWSPDTWQQLWDAISMPRAVYGKHLRGERSATDCDDISIFAAYCIERARRRVDLGKTIVDVGLLSCPWVVHQNAKVSGHNVCAFAYRDNGSIKWAHISNWFGGKIQWDFPNKSAIVKSMTRNRATSLGWAYARVSLKPKGNSTGNVASADYAKLKLKLTEYHWKTEGN